MKIVYYIASMDTTTLLVMVVLVAVSIAIIAIARAIFSKQGSAIIYAGGMLLGVIGSFFYLAYYAFDWYFPMILADLLTAVFVFCLPWGLRTFNDANRPWSPRYWFYLAVWLVMHIAMLFVHGVVLTQYVIKAMLFGLITIETMVAIADKSHLIPVFIVRVVRAIGIVQLVTLIISLVGIFIALSNFNYYIQEKFTRNSFFLLLGFYLSLWAQTVFITEISHFIEDLKRKNAILDNLSVTDALTGLFNRHHFNTTAEAEIARASRYNQSLCLIMFDLDHFKHINDTWGHQVGDSVLQLTASVVKSKIRETDMLFRWGGEEFLILAPNTDSVGAVSLAEKIRAAMASSDFPNVGSVTASFGVAEWKTGMSAELLLKDADSALYTAKKSGRNTVCCFRAS